MGDRYEITELWRAQNLLTARVVELEKQVKELHRMVSREDFSETK